MIDTEYYNLISEYNKRFESDKYDISIYPPFWLDIEDMEVKKQVLKRALEENKLIIDVKDGDLFVEGIIID